MVEPDELASLYSPKSVRVLVGCAPCQPFSGYTARRRQFDDRWKLLLDFLRLTKAISPEVVTLENVPRLVHLDVWRHFILSLSAAGYHVVWRVLDASAYGVPQRRRRLVLLASRLGPISLPSPVSGPAPPVRAAVGALQ